MTLVLSMNPFLDPEGDILLSAGPPMWESGRRSDPDPTCSSEPRHAPEPPCGRVPDPVSMSRTAFFKRKIVDDDKEPPYSLRTYCQTVAPVLEERAHVLRLSLEKMRFIDDPETFLRRSVLINNLLRRLRAEILLQSSDWCFLPPPPPGGSARQPDRTRLPPQAGPSLRKRIRVGPELRPGCAQMCCCVYTAAGRYLPVPLSVYDAALSGAPPTASTPPLQVGVPEQEEEQRGKGPSDRYKRRTTTSVRTASRQKEWKN